MPALEPKLSRRSFIKTGILAFIGLSGAGTVSYSYLSRLDIEINKIKITSPRIPPSFKEKKIVHISDLHFGFFLHIPELTEIAARIKQMNPDMICFTGDLIDHEFTRSQATEVAKILRGLTAELGKFAILGNHDYWGNVALVQTCLQESGFTLLKNDVTEIKWEDDYIYLSGIDDVLAGTPDMEPVDQRMQTHKDIFHIALVHEPDYANEMAYHDVDLQLSGHSHGGQIALPLIGPILTPQGSKKYTTGLYKINDRLTLYTNRGLGTTILPLRFFCKPELTLIELG